MYVGDIMIILLYVAIRLRRLFCVYNLSVTSQAQARGFRRNAANLCV